MTETQDKDSPGVKWPALRRILRYLSYIFIFIVAMQLGQLWLQRDVVLGMAPPIEAVNLDGKRVSLSEFRGRPLLLYFWGSWCPVCRFEHGTITSLAEDYQVLSIALQSGTAGEVKSHMQEHDAVYEVVNDPDGNIGHEFGIRGVPTIFLLDHDGNIHTVLSGFTTGVSLRLRLWLLSRK